MTQTKKITLLSVVISSILGFVTLIVTTGGLPFKAGQWQNRLCEVEKENEKLIDKVDKVVEDVAYIRGWIEGQDKEK